MGLQTELNIMALSHLHMLVSAEVIALAPKSSRMRSRTHSPHSGCQDKALVTLTLSQQLLGPKVGTGGFQRHTLAGKQ